MKHRIVSLIILIFWLASSFLANLALAPAAKADATDWYYVSTDLDGDGLPNTVEQQGWCNAVGCFQTDPLRADTDGDGLTDGEEKLYDSNPKDSSSPGIYVLYQNEFKTQEYYPWQPYGHRMIARGDTFSPPRPDDIDRSKGHPDDLDAVVVRRGATFYVGGPISATLTINKSISTLTTLTPTKDAFSGRWKVTIPTNATVGKYTLNLAGKTLDLFVIFELPAPAGQLTQQQIDKFLYDNDPGKDYDEIALILGTTREYPPINSPQPPYFNQLNSNKYISEGFTYKFKTQQYNRYILEDYVIGAINGQNNQKSAIDKLATAVDKNTVFRNPRILYDSWTVLNPGSNPRQECSNVASLLTTFNRASGIPAQNVAVDWRHSSFDHSTEIWVNNEWRVYRGYRTYEMKPAPDNTPQGCRAPAWPGCGTENNRTRAWWGQNKYKPWHSNGRGSGDIIVRARDDWTFNGVGPFGGNLDYRWPSWNIHSIVKNERRVKTVTSEYWPAFGWTTEPTIERTLPQYPASNTWPNPPAGGSALTLSGSDTSSLQASTSGSDPTFAASTSGVTLGPVVAEYTVDANGNGKANQLVLRAEVTVPQAGQYWLLGQLNATRPASLPLPGSDILAVAVDSYQLNAGTQTVKLVFDGADIALGRADGPYLLSGLWITDVAQPDRGDFFNNGLASLEDGYTTQAYRASDFDSYGALLSGIYTHATVDSDNDGAVDALVVTTGINIDQPGSYTVEGSLYDNQGQLISTARWTGAGSTAALTFDNVAGTVGPYNLVNLNLLNSQGQMVDQLVDAYTIGPIPALTEAGLVAFSTATSGGGGGIGTFDATFPANPVFNATLDNGNLRFDAQVNVTSSPDTYRMEAWLVDANDDLVTWATGQTTTLSVGTHTLSLTFDGKAIRAHGVPGPYRVAAVKIIDANSGAFNVRDTENVALTTQPYTLNQFAADPNTIISFEDFMENGAGQWTAQSPWAITTNEYFTAHAKQNTNHTWKAANANATLSLASPLDFTGIISPALRFQSAQIFNSGSDKGHVEVSTDGVNWQTLATLSNQDYWSTQIADLNNYAGLSNIRLRFRLASAGGVSNDGWYFDDALVIGVPGELPVDDISFTYTPAPPIKQEIVTFTTAVTPAGASKPITYTWNFGDGAGEIVTTNPDITHSFANAGNYTVVVTATNEHTLAPAVYSEPVEVLDGLLTGISFDYSPANPLENRDVTFTPVISPVRVTEPVTYTWNFGDGTEIDTTAASIIHAFSPIGSYTVTVTATNGLGSPVSYSEVIEVNGSPVEEVNFTWTPIVPDPNETVSFTASISPTGATTPVTYTWSFGDGPGSTVTTTPNIDHSFGVKGIYTVQVTASNIYGSATYSQTVGVGGIPVDTIDFNYNPASPVTEDNITFTTATTPINADTPITYTWNFGDGSSEVVTTSDNVNYSYPNIGSYTVTLTATNGYSLPVAVSKIVDVDGRPVSQVSFDYIPTAPRETEIISFTTTITPVNALQPITYTWSFGDGSDPIETNETTIEYSYPTAGSYTVIVTASNGYGAPVSQTQTVDVLGWPVDDVSFEYSPASPLDNDPVEFTPLVDPATATQPITYTWSFGDGSSPVITTTDIVEFVYTTPGTYTVVLTAANQYNSQPAVYTDTVVVNGRTPEFAFFGYFPTAPVENDVVTFEAGMWDPGTEPMTYTWDFGDGTTLATTNVEVTHVFTSVGSYVVTLIISNDYGAAEPFSRTIQVTGRPVSQISLTYNPLAPMENDTVSFSAAISPTNATQPITYTWNFGDGTSPVITNSSNISHSFVSKGNYTVAVTATNGYGSPVATSTLVIVGGRPVDEVGFTYNPASPLEDDNVTFTSSITPSYATQPVTYTWNFGDGTSTVTTNNTTVNHTFADVGNYTVVVTAANGYGLPVNASKVVVVGGRPITDVTLTKTAPAAPQENDLVSFAAAIAPANATQPVTYTWNFGDGSPPVVNNSSTANHTFTAVGSYTVTVTANNGFGSANDTLLVVIGGRPITDVTLTKTAPAGQPLQNDIVSFAAAIAPANATQPVTYTWNFGDGSPPVVNNSSTITHSFTAVGNYTVVVTASNGYGSDNASLLVVIGGRPITDVTLTKTAPAAPQENDLVSFAAAIAPANATQPVTYTWNFGDGSPPVVNNSSTANHTFTAVGSYTVTVTANNGFGSANDTLLVVIDGRPVDEASFVYSPTNPLENELVTFTATITPNNATQPVSYLWDFGDGSTPVTTSPVITHTFNNVGSYTVWLNVVNGYGPLTVYSKTIQIDGHAITDVTLSKTAPVTPVENDVVSFLAQVAPANATTPISYTWNFGDGSPLTTTTTSAISHTYTSIGDFTVSVTADNGFGSDSDSLPVTIGGRPITGVTLTKTAPAQPQENDVVSFLAAILPANATQPVTYTWNFGDGSPTEQVTLNANSHAISHTFTTVGNYTVTVTADNGYSSASKNLVVGIGGVLVDAVTLSKTGPASPLTGDPVDFAAQITPGNATEPVVYTWNFGDGSPAEQTTTTNTISHAYTAAGTFTVTVSADNGFGPAVNDEISVVIGVRPLNGVTLTKTSPITPAVDDVVSFEAQIDPLNATQPVLYTWDFGDGSPISTTTTSTITHVFTDVNSYTVVVTASNSGGDVSDSLVVDVTGLPLTSISFTHNPPAPRDGQLVNFNSLINPSNATEPITYTWDFGDGTAPTITTADAGGNSVQHTFAEGSYTVVVTAENNYGPPVVYSTTINIAAPAPGSGIIFLPVIMSNAGPQPPPPPTYPDLVVESIVATTDGNVQVVIKNQGNAAVTNQFWVDLYVNPNPVPTGVNQIWNDGRSQNGIVWGVTSAFLPSLTPGGSVTLTLGNAWYGGNPPLTNYPSSLPAGTPIYVQVDSANTTTSYGGVLENHEAGGGAYNNIKAGQVTAPGATGQGMMAAENLIQPSTSSTNLPAR